jgi:hypothetical protein
VIRVLASSSTNTTLQLHIRPAQVKPSPFVCPSTKHDWKDWYNNAYRSVPILPYSEIVHFGTCERQLNWAWHRVFLVLIHRASSYFLKNKSWRRTDVGWILLGPVLYIQVQKYNWVREPDKYRIRLRLQNRNLLNKFYRLDLPFQNQISIFY